MTEASPPEGAAPNSPQMGLGSGLPPEELDRLTDDIVAALKTVYDPEIPADIYELGLIYRVDVDDERNVVVDMTLTAPGCPVAGEMPVWVENAVASVPGVKAVTVNMGFDPPWDQSACPTRRGRRSTCGWRPRRTATEFLSSKRDASADRAGLLSSARVRMRGCLRGLYGRVKTGSRSARR